MSLYVLFTPHPPIIIDTIGGIEKEKALYTIEGMHELGRQVAKERPETIIFISPHGNSFSNGTCLLGDEALYGDFSQFGHSELLFNKKVNLELTDKIYACFEACDYVSVMMDAELAKTYNIRANLDHGVMVPMYFIDKYYKDYDIVHITPGHTPLEENYFLGKLIKDMVDDYTNEKAEKVMLVASGDLSHALLSDGPYEYNENGPIFDQRMQEAISEKNPLKLIHMDKKVVDQAAQCGLRSYLMGFGYLDGLKYDSKVISYEGPFGVGYLTGYLRAIETEIEKKTSTTRGRVKGNTKYSHIECIQMAHKEKYKERMNKEDDYIRLARKTIEEYVRKNTKYRPEEGIFSQGFLKEAGNKKAGVFVSIHKDGKLRGCIGTTEGTSASLIDETIYNAISACSSDPRFHPVERLELEELEIKVDILLPSEKIDSMLELNPKKYGVIVEQGDKRGLLLPNLEGVSTVSEQVSIAKQKAGIVRGRVDLFRFEVERHEL